MRPKATLRHVELESRIVPNTPQLTLDANPYNAASVPNNFCEVGDRLFFAANDGFTGLELWTSDGTSSGTRLVRNIHQETTLTPLDSRPRYLTNFNGILYFSANDGSQGYELWRSDGTSSGTFAVADLNGATASAPRNFALLNNQLFFSASGSGVGRELHRTDGTSSGTVLVKDINPTGSSTPDSFTVGPGGILYFKASDGGATGTELWRSNGTFTGTSLVCDIYPGPSNNSQPSRGVFVGSQMYFSASDGVGGQELWTTDGTSTGTRNIADSIPGNIGITPVQLIAHANGVFFYGRKAVGYELWFSDGTSTGTEMVADLYTGLNNGVDENQPMWVFNDTLFFPGRTEGNEQELWTSDGTSSGTRLFYEFVPGSGGGYPRRPGVFGSNMVFHADGTLWTSDGTSSGTVRIPGAYASAVTGDPPNVVEAAGKLFFSGTTAVHGRELWATDGTASGTALVRNIYQRTNDSGPSLFVAVGDSLFYTANDGLHARELWKSDGTSSGTAMIYDVRSHPYYGTFDTNFNAMAERNGVLYFSAGISDTLLNGMLYRADGTSTGSSLVMPAEDPNSPRDILYLTNLNGQLLFRGNRNSGHELWTSDGTSTGTRLVRDIYPGSSSSQITGFYPHGELAYFSADEGTKGGELWRTDGASSGTELIRDINPGAGGSSISQFASLNSVLYFRANDGVNGPELWRSDGTSSGTYLVRDIYPGATGSSPTQLTVFQNHVFFRANNPVSGLELWRSDGTSSGTVLVQDLAAGTFHSSPSGLTVVGPTLFFAANSASTSTELWKITSATGGMSLVRDIRPGGASDPSLLANVAGRLYFRANDGVNGFELWRSDGTSTGTVLLDLEPGYAADPNAMLAVRGRLYVSLFQSDIGRELFQVPDTFAPELSSISTTEANGTYTTGQSLTINLNFNEDVVLEGGDIILTLNSGATLVIPPLSGNTAYVVYTVGAGDGSPRLNVASVALTPGAVIRDLSGNLLTLTLPTSNLADTSSILVNPLPPTTVTAVTVNAGAHQRSRLLSLELSFGTPVDAAKLNQFGAITLTRTAGGTALVVRTGAPVGAGRIRLEPPTGFVTSLVMTFDTNGGPPVAGGVENHSLADGRWQLAIPWLQFASPLNSPTLRRLFGDADANGTVDGGDFAAFGAAFAGTVADSPFDFDANGTIDGADFAAFGTRFGITL